MAEHEVGALMVMQGDRLEGIFSGATMHTKVILHGKTSRETLVRRS